MKKYEAPALVPVGRFVDLTLGTMGSFNDGGGGGTGMAELDSMGMTDQG